MASASARKAARQSTSARRAPSIVQEVAWELKGSVRGSLLMLSRASGISLDALRVAKRQPGTVGARPLAPTRARLLALLLAAHRRGLLTDLLREATAIELEWSARFRNGLTT